MRRSTGQQSPEANTGRRGVVQRLHWVLRWMYRGGRPRALARVMNRLSALQFSAGLLSPGRAMTMQVRGRRTGKTISFPVVVAEHEGRRYLVSMLGEDANWVHNVRAAEGKAVLRRHGAEEVRLVEVAPRERAPILRSYLDAAPGARPHVPVDRHAPLEQFERIADRYPVFRIVPAAPATLPGDTTQGAARPPSPTKGFLIGLLYPPLVVGLMYLSGVKYTDVTDSASNVATALVGPGLVMAALLVLLTSWLGWWQPVLREQVTAPRWLVAIPVLWVAAILIGTDYARAAQLSSAFLVWATIATLFIGFGEELTYRGLSIVGLRGGMSEAKVWLLSSLMFGLAHSANIVLGQSVGDTAVQLVYAFVLGSLLYAIRRATGLLVIAILLHAGWDWMLFVSQSKALADAGETLHGDPSAVPNVIAVVMVILFAIGARGLFRNRNVGANSA